MNIHTFSELREYILSHIENMTGLKFKAKEKNSKKTVPSVFLIEKPDIYELSNIGIIIKFNEISTGNDVRHYAIELKIESKEIADLLTTKEALVSLLDFYNRPCEIANYVKFVFSNEGGFYFDKNINLYVDKLFFDCKLI